MPSEPRWLGYDQLADHLKQFKATLQQRDYTGLVPLIKSHQNLMRQLAQSTLNDEPYNSPLIADLQREIRQLIADAIQQQQGLTASRSLLTQKKKHIISYVQNQPRSL